MAPLAGRLSDRHPPGLLGGIGLALLGAGMALLAGPVRKLVSLVLSGTEAWTEAYRRAQEDEKTWNAALHDARILADLSRAMNGIAVEDMRRYR